MIGVILATCGVFFIPGTLMLFRKEFFPHLSLIEKLPLCIAASLGYWIIAVWWLSLIPISLSSLVIGTVVSFMPIYLLVGRKVAYIRRFPVYPAIDIVPLFFLAIATPQAILLISQLVPSGQDMTMHAYIANAILQNNAFPTTLLPVIPVDSFGLYPFGFSAVIAVMSRVNTLPIHTSALILTGLVHFLFDTALYLILRSKFSPVISAMVAGIVAWTSANPHLFVTWGANPSVLSLAFLFFAVAVFLSPTRNALANVIAVFFLSASFLTNYMFVIAALYIGLPLGIVLLLKHQRLATIFDSAKLVVLSIVVSLFPLAVKFISRHPMVSEATILFIRGLHFEETARWNGAFSLTGIRQIAEIVGGITDTQLLLIAGIAALLLLKQSPKTVILSTYLGIWVTLFVVNARHWWLPFSSLLYPYRIVIYLLIPISYLLAMFLTRVKEKSAWLYLLLCIGFIAISVPRFRMLEYVSASKAKNMVTSNDLAALYFLGERTKQTDIIWNRYEDAGLWIPAIISRPITTYHTNPVDMDAIRGRNIKPPDFAFIGETNPQETPFSETIEAEFPEATAWEYDLIYARGKAKIYMIRRAP
jgi:hypothetical protein